MTVVVQGALELVYHSQGVIVEIVILLLLLLLYHFMATNHWKVYREEVWEVHGTIHEKRKE